MEMCGVAGLRHIRLTVCPGRRVSLEAIIAHLTERVEQRSKTSCFHKFAVDE